MLEPAKPADKLENLKFLAGQLKEFTTGMQAVQTGDLAAAQIGSMKLDAELWHMSQRLRDAPKKEKHMPATRGMSAELPEARQGRLLSGLSFISHRLRAAVF